MDEELERFTLLLANIEDFDNDTRLTIGRELLEFMKTNQEKYQIPDEMIANSEIRHAKTVKAVEKAAETERQAEIARREFEIAEQELEEALIEEMEKNDGNPVPVFTNLPKRGN